MTVPTITRGLRSDPSVSAPSLVVLVSTRAVITQDDDKLVLGPATVVISPATGKITSVSPEILPPSSFPPSTSYTDVSPQLLLPGLVDAHVHLNEPGRAEWEGFYTGTRAAASGGVTTVVDMPLNAIPPTTTIDGFRQKLAASRGKCWVDVAFYGGVIPGNADQLLPLVEAGVRGFKGFLIESGVDEFPAVSSRDIALAMQTLKDTPTTLMFHAEMIPPLADSVGDAVQTSDPPLAPHGSLTSYDTFLQSRPPSFETYALDEILSLAPLAPNLDLHIVHLSAAEGIPILREARSKGIRITAETCFHYLALKAEDVADGDTRHKCCPPIRNVSNQEALWQELAAEDSCIRTVVSDHSPCTPELKLLPPGIANHGTNTSFDDDTLGRPLAKHKPDSGIDLTLPANEIQKPAPPTVVTPIVQPDAKRGDFFAAWGGISSVGLGLPILSTAIQTAPESSAASTLTWTDVVRLCSQTTARQVGLAHRKGGLRAGLDADICVFDDQAEWVLDAAGMRWRNRCSPWDGKLFRGMVKETWLRGERVYVAGSLDGGLVGGGPRGQAITEKRVA